MEMQSITNVVSIHKSISSLTHLIDLQVHLKLLIMMEIQSITNVLLVILLWIDTTLVIDCISIMISSFKWTCVCILWR